MLVPVGLVLVLLPSVGDEARECLDFVNQGPWPCPGMPWLLILPGSLLQRRYSNYFWPADNIFWLFVVVLLSKPLGISYC